MEETISKFRKLLETTKYLMGPKGCPWDRDQTILSMRGALLEEAYEVLETIDEGDDPHLVEELGDLLYNVIFFCQLGEKEERFTINDVIEKICEKLISRHPHVFGEKSGSTHTAETALQQWDKIKHSKRESLMD